MKHWYRYECVEESRKDEFCKFLRRAKLQYESGGPGKRKLFRKDGYNHTGGVLPRSEVFFVRAFLSEDELDKANAWLAAH